MKTKDRRCAEHKAESYYGFCYKENKMMCQMCATKYHILHFDKHINFYQVYKRELKQVKNILNEDGPAYERQLAVLQDNRTLSSESIAKDFARINSDFQQELRFNLDKIYSDTIVEFQRITDKLKNTLTEQLAKEGTLQTLDNEFNLIFNLNDLHASAQNVLSDTNKSIPQIEQEYAKAVQTFQSIDQNKSALFDLKMARLKQVSEVNRQNQISIKNQSRTFMQQNIQQALLQTKQLEEQVHQNIESMLSSLAAIK